MSKDVPLLASEKLKLGCLITIIAMLAIAALIGSWKKIYRAIVRDKKGYEQAMESLADRAYFEVIDFDTSLNSYRLDVKSDAWRSWTWDQKYEYCDNCYNAIYKAQQTYRMYAESDKPWIDFYVNNRRVANVGGGATDVYD